MERMFATIAASAALLLCAAQAPPPGTPSGSPAPADPAAADGADEWALGDRDTRMTVPVSIAGRGEWPFVIDTGAERTVVSQELVDRLALQAGPVIRVTTMAGTAPTPTARVPLLKVSRLMPALIEAPVYRRDHIGADGMLGLDALQGHRVAIDFAGDRMTLVPAEKRSRLRPRDSDEIVVVARSRFGQLIVTDAHWRGRRVSVIVDTGSAVTIANGAFLKMMASVRSRPVLPYARWSLFAASGEELLVDAYRLDRIEIGSIGLVDVPIAIRDVAPFARFGLAERPALLLGMQTLRAFRRVEIDFPNRAIRFTLPGQGLGLGLRM